MLVCVCVQEAIMQEAIMLLTNDGVCVCVQETIKQLTEDKYRLQTEEEKGKMSPEERREALMVEIKRDNAEIESATGRIKEANESIKQMESRLGGGSSETADDASRRYRAYVLRALVPMYCFSLPGAVLLYCSSLQGTALVCCFPLQGGALLYYSS
jgi:hypothetical protein